MKLLLTQETDSDLRGVTILDDKVVKSGKLFPLKTKGKHEKHFTGFNLNLNVHRAILETLRETIQ